MREISSSVTFEIKAGETVPMKIARSTRLKVNCGAVWVTRSDDTEDYWLESGHTLRLRRGERLWLSVEGGPEAQVAFAVPARADVRALDWLMRLGDRFGMRLRDGWRTV
ncbi:DUF2917 domain-containing protein [Paraburkholderia phenazinium]|jgi:hypothetical protein|uniref:DUF2917 family protein n=1 Tax=Paraburkholderia phenazinium TaxID=60549 RepID=A0A1G7NZT6_9BURK|nr:DUF2917 domain-containing protein [Paraburkholderia phenazinium]SDF78700.1 Protein of unknown function [Paraburkholderia phenazinium]